MKPEDVIKQLVGETTDWDQHDTMLFSFYECSKFDGALTTIDFDNGILAVYNEDGTEEVNRYAIKATLCPLED